MHKQQKLTRGRPRFRVIPQRLRALRKQVGLSQIELAKRLYKRMEDDKTALSVMKSNYQRWERTGAMTPVVAKHLADELNTTVAILQGATPEAPASALERIEARLRYEVAAGNPATLMAVESYAEDEDPVRELASRVAGRLEAAQLSQDRAELSQLAALTAWRVADLQLPIGGEGHWLLVGLGNLASARTELIQSVAALAYEVRNDLQEVLGRFAESDASVSFHEEAPWFRIEVKHPRISQLTRTLRFVRAQPTEQGLHWTNPSIWDRDVVGRLPSDTWSMANFVSGFSQQATARLDVTQLRFALFTNPRLDEVEKHWPQEPPTEIVGVAKLRDDEPPISVIESFQRDGCLHDLLTNWLSSRLWDEVLHPLFRAWPLDYWRFSGAQRRIDVVLEIPLSISRERREVPRMGPSYHIELVQELPSGELRRVPWRQASVMEIRERLEKFLGRERERSTDSAPLPLT